MTAEAPKKPIIKTQDLSVIYFPGRSNSVNALVGANIEIYPGEFVIFFGPSGCGKSTLLYAIAGLERNISGDIFIDGVDLTKFTLKELEYHHQIKIGMIFQAYYLINSLSILKNIILPQLSLNVVKQEREERAVSLMEKFNIKPQAYKYPSELSGGQQQRTAICRALINNPDIILADEPTGNLDSKSAGDVMDLLKKLNEEDKKTIILVTHSPRSLHYAHRVFYMKDGMIIETKVYRPLGVKEVVPSILSAAQKMKVYRELEILTKTYTDFSADKFGEMLISFKAQEIVAEALANMTVEEMAGIVRQVEKILIEGVKKNKKLFFEYLDKNAEDGGLGLDKRTAETLANKIGAVIEEIQILQKKESEAVRGLPYKEDEEIYQIRQYLLDHFEVNLHNASAISAINRSIRERLENKINGLEFQKQLDAPLERDGVGLDKRTARKLARHMELLMLGKFSDNPPMPKFAERKLPGPIDESAKKSAPILPAGHSNIFLSALSRLFLIYQRIRGRLKSIKLYKKLWGFIAKLKRWYYKINNKILNLCSGLAFLAREKCLGFLRGIKIFFKTSQRFLWSVSLGTRRAIISIIVKIAGAIKAVLQMIIIKRAHVIRYYVLRAYYFLRAYSQTAAHKRYDMYLNFLKKEFEKHDLHKCKHNLEKLRKKIRHIKIKKSYN